MSRIAYVNGRYLPMRSAMVHVEDRGYQFGDGVYEVCEVREGRLIDERRHLARLKRSLDELRIRAPMSPAALGIVLREVIARNRIGYGIVYLQVTRGVARRDHAFPAPDVPPSRRGDGASRSTAGATRRWRPPASPSSAYRTIAGTASTSRRSGCCPMCWRGKPLSSKARAMPGSSTRTASSPEARFGQRLDRHAGRRAGHAPGRSRHPARHHPHGALRRRQGAGAYA